MPLATSKLQTLNARMPLAKSRVPSQLHEYPEQNQYFQSKCNGGGGLHSIIIVLCLLLGMQRKILIVVF
jgi:hypothetical protein